MGEIHTGVVREDLYEEVKIELRFEGRERTGRRQPRHRAQRVQKSCGGARQGEIIR